MDEQEARRQILEAVKPVLVAVLAPEDYQWAIAVFHEVILPYRLRLYSSKTAEGRRTMVESIVNSLVDQFRQLPPAELKQYLMRQKYEALIKPIDKRAYELAVHRYKKESALELLQPEAEQLHHQLLEIVGELEKTAPEIYKQYSRAISESLLDLKYAVAGTKGTSLHLYGFMRASENHGKQQ